MPSWLEEAKEVPSWLGKPTYQKQSKENNFLRASSPDEAGLFAQVSQIWCGNWASEEDLMTPAPERCVSLFSDSCQGVHCCVCLCVCMYTVPPRGKQLMVTLQDFHGKRLTEVVCYCLPLHSTPGILPLLFALSWLWGMQLPSSTVFVIYCWPPREFPWENYYPLRPITAMEFELCLPSLCQALHLQDHIAKSDGFSILPRVPATRANRETG